MFVISQQNEARFKFDFKVIGANEGDIVPGRDYWARGYLSSWHSVAQSSNLKCLMNGNSITITNRNGSETKYKIEGEFTQEEIDVVNSGLSLDLKIDFLLVTLKSLGVTGLKAIIETRKENVAA